MRSRVISKMQVAPPMDCKDEITAGAYVVLPTSYRRATKVNERVQGTYSLCTVFFVIFKYSAEEIDMICQVIDTI